MFAGPAARGRGDRGLVDGAYPDARPVLEADSRRWHTQLRDPTRHHLQEAEAARVEWQMLRFVYEQITGDPDEVCAIVRDLREVLLRSWEPRPDAAAVVGSHRRGAIRPVPDVLAVLLSEFDAGLSDGEGEPTLLGCRDRGRLSAGGGLPAATPTLDVVNGRIYGETRCRNFGDSGWQPVWIVAERRY